MSCKRVLACGAALAAALAPAAGRDAQGHADRAGRRRAPGAHARRARLPRPPRRPGRATALQVALDEGRFELDAAQAERRAGDAVRRRRLEAARAAAQAAEKAGAAVLLTDLPADWTARRGRRRQAAGAQPRRGRRPPARSRTAAPACSTCCPASACAATRWRRRWCRANGASCCCWSGPAPHDQRARRDRAGLDQALRPAGGGEQALQALGRPARARPGQPAAADRRRRPTTPSGWSTATASSRARCPTAPCCRARWSATPAWWRWPGTRSSSASARRRCRAALPRPPSGR